jgi:hypothetical protein
MTITVHGYTLGNHTHLTIWVNQGRVSDERLCLRNDDVAEFLARLRPVTVVDETIHPHRRVLAEYAV